jgi:hypothetical protein
MRKSFIWSLALRKKEMMMTYYCSSDPFLGSPARMSHFMAWLKSNHLGVPVAGDFGGRDADVKPTGRYSRRSRHRTPATGLERESE